MTVILWHPTLLVRQVDLDIELEENVKLLQETLSNVQNPFIAAGEEHSIKNKSMMHHRLFFWNT